MSTTTASMNPSNSNAVRRRSRATAARRCCSCLDITKEEIKIEVIRLMQLAWPVMLYQALVFGLTIVSVFFAGHLGPTELAAASLGQSFIHVCCKSVIYGFCTAFDTLFAQTYGSKNKKRVGVILQRGILTVGLVCAICVGVLINTRAILLLMGQDPEVSRLAGVYAYIYIIGLPADMVAYVLIKYVQSQNYMVPTAVVMLITTVMNVVFHVILITVLGYGLSGAIFAQVCSYYVLVILLLVYIKYKDIHVETWGGWTLDCLQEWGLIFRLGIPGAFMLCLEWWSFEVGFYVVGTLGTAHLGAHTILFYTATLLWSLAGGLATGGSIHIGNLLGANKPRKAQTTSLILIAFAVIMGVFFSAWVLALKDVLGYVFTSDREILQIASEAMFIFAGFIVLDQMNGVIVGILRGTGHFLFGAAVCFISYTCVGISLYMVLVFVFGMGVKGLWTGLLVGMAVMNTLNISFILRINWDVEALKAIKRAAATSPTRNEQQDSHDSIAEMKEEQDKLCPAPAAGVNGKHCPLESEKVASNSTIKEESVEMLPVEIIEHKNSAKNSGFTATKTIGLENTEPDNSATNSTATKTADTENGLNKDTEGGTEEQSTTTQDEYVLTANPLPWGQLLVTRILTVVGCVAWICCAVVFNLMITIPSNDVLYGTGNGTTQGNYTLTGV